MKEFATKEEFLKDEIEYYGANPSERRCYGEGRCVYSPITAKKEGKSEGCAIGRHLTPENAKILDAKGVGSVRQAIRDYNNLIPVWMLNLGGDFLMECQWIHDDKDYWNMEGKGLSNYGKMKVNSLIALYNLQMERYVTD